MRLSGTAPPRLPGRSCPTRLRSISSSGGRRPAPPSWTRSPRGLSRARLGGRGYARPGIPWVGFSTRRGLCGWSARFSRPRPRIASTRRWAATSSTTPRGSRSRQGTRASPTTTGRGTRSRSGRAAAEPRGTRARSLAPAEPRRRRSGRLGAPPPAGARSCRRSTRAWSFSTRPRVSYPR